jgi:hypothetical protein
MFPVRKRVQTGPRGVLFQSPFSEFIFFQYNFSALKVWDLNNPGIHYGLSVVLMCIIHPHYAKLSICIAYCQRLVMQFSNVRHQSFISGQGLCFFLIKPEAPLRLIDEKRSWVNANETTTSNQLVLNQIVLPNIHWLNTTDMKMDLSTKLKHDQNICKDQYIRVNLYAATTAVHMGQFNSTDIQFICICTISVCQNAMNIDVLFFVFLFLVIFNT